MTRRYHLWIVLACLLGLAFISIARAEPVTFTQDESIAVLNGLDLLSKQVGLNPAQRGQLAAAASAFDKVQSAAKLKEEKKEEPK